MDEVTQADEDRLIDAIIAAYHTTRLSDVPVAMHIRSKGPVQEAFEAVRIAERERIKDAAKPCKNCGFLPEKTD